MAETTSKAPPSFDPQMLRRQLSIDSTLRWALLLGVLAALLGGNVLPDVDALVWNGLLIVLAVVWVATSTSAARVARQLPTMHALIEHDPAAAQSHLAAFMHRRMLHRPVRLMLYHQLAALRHRQERFAESAAICQSVLQALPAKASDPIRLPGVISAGQHVRAQLLLLLTESRLQCRDLMGAYLALAALHQCQLNLVESLQRLALQTHYEVVAGHDGYALSNLAAKIRHAELMPAAQCGALHAMLAFAAKRSHQLQLADWLSRRVQLLCTPEQLAHFMRWLTGVGPASADAPPAQLM